MRLLKLDLNKLTKTKDSVKEFYSALTTQFNSLELTQSNSYISKVCGFYSEDHPDRAIVTVTTMDTEINYDFIYDRFNIAVLVETKPKLQASDITTIVNSNQSETVVERLRERHNIAYMPEDFWVDARFIEWANHSKDRFILEATFDSLWFTGKTSILLAETPQ